jgi:hypothetical protein
MSKAKVNLLLPVVLILVVMGTWSFPAGYQQTPARAAEDESQQTKMPATDAAKINALIAAVRGSAKMKSLLKERYDAAFTECQGRWQDFLVGRGTLDIMLGCSGRLRDAERELSPRKADQIAALEAHWKRVQKVKGINQARFDAGQIAIQDLAESQYFRLDAEIQLERAKGTPQPGD